MRYTCSRRCRRDTINVTQQLSHNEIIYSIYYYYLRGDVVGRSPTSPSTQLANRSIENIILGFRLTQMCKLNDELWHAKYVFNAQNY